MTNSSYVSCGSASLCSEGFGGAPRWDGIAATAMAGASSLVRLVLGDGNDGYEKFMTVSMLCLGR